MNPRFVAPVRWHDGWVLSAADLAGLTTEQVATRVAAGQTNGSQKSTGRTFVAIVRANVFTRFNAILGSLFVVVLIVGPIQDGLFGVILVVNTAIGIVQEVRAKLELDRLAVLTAPGAVALRDGQPTQIALTDVVLDDVLLLELGDQVVADGEVIEAAGLEVDESLLSGEAEPALKRSGDSLLSGSVIVAGTARMLVTAVGDDAYAQRLQSQARQFDQVRSELVEGTNQILRAVTWVMIPAGVLLVTSQLLRSGQSLDEALRSSVAGVGAMVPEGLVLLTSIAFALGALRLARRQVLVQELAAIEGLARVDVLCIDKTGTLTEPGIALGAVTPIADVSDADVRSALGALAGSDPSPNATMTALLALPAPDGWVPEDRVPFSSARKWSATQFDGRATWVLGAPEIVLGRLEQPVAERVSQEATLGHRVLALARSAQPLRHGGGSDVAGAGAGGAGGDGGGIGDRGDAVLPDGLEPVALVAFEERIRDDAAATVAYLLDQGIEVKVVSGDNPETVAAVASKVGIAGSADPVDARTLPEGHELGDVLARHTIFGRVQPNQKAAIVTALQSQGRVVAMTGDGVNDIPALKVADLGMAMGSGSPATRAVGRVVLLSSSFSVVPQIVDEGRRVIANVQRVANLFVTKTVYAALLAVVVGVLAVPYPFYPRHLTIVSSLTIGIPGFFLALAPGAPRAQPGFVRRVASFSVPAGIVAAAATFTAYALARGPCGVGLPQSRTVATFVLLVVGLGVLVMVARPMTAARWVLVVAMAVAGLAVWLLPLGRRIFGLATPPPWAFVAALGVLAVALPVLVRVLQTTSRRMGRSA
jgi:cation-transporting ATPase E